MKLEFKLPPGIAPTGELSKLDRQRLIHEALALPDWNAAQVLRTLLATSASCQACTEDSLELKGAARFAVSTLEEAAKTMRKSEARLLVVEALRALKAATP